MSAHPSLPDAMLETTAWGELEEVLEGLGRLARQDVAPQKFYRDLLSGCLSALSAVGGVVWRGEGGGPLHPGVQINWPGAELAQDRAARQAHEALLAQVLAEGKTISVPPRTGQPDHRASNLTDYQLLLGPICQGKKKLAIVEIIPRPDASPLVTRGQEQFLTALCEIATDFHAYRELAQLQSREIYRGQLLRLGQQVHRDLDLSTTAATVVNEGRRMIDCDRLSVIVAQGRRLRLLATSGVSRVERRSSTVRRLEAIAKQVLQLEEPVFYSDGQCDALPPMVEALDHHAEESHVRQIAIVPIGPPIDDGAINKDINETTSQTKRAKPSIVLVAEQFHVEKPELLQERLVEVSEVCSTALINGQAVDQLPFHSVLRLLVPLKRQIMDHFPRTLFVLGSIGAIVAALLLVEADFVIKAPGTLQPSERREVFASRSGLVDQVFVRHGDDVQKEQPLVQLRDPLLDLEIKRVLGEIETVGRQLDAVRATKTDRAAVDASLAQKYRLSADQRELESRLANLRRERKLLDDQRQSLLLRSPIVGRVLTWDLENLLMARPVERGEVLVSVADLSAEWKLELQVPDDQMGHVMAARDAKIREGEEPHLAVHYRLSSDDNGGKPRVGHVERVSMMANVDTEKKEAASPAVMIQVALDRHAQENFRPGTSARAQIACGRRSLGYVWLHDIWETVWGWVQF